MPSLTMLARQSRLGAPSSGVELAGHPSGGVRPPLTEVAPEHREELARIIAAGLDALPGSVAADPMTTGR